MHHTGLLAPIPVLLLALHLPLLTACDAPDSMKQSIFEFVAELLPLPDGQIRSAIKSGDVAYVEDYLANGGNPDLRFRLGSKGDHNWTFLMGAVAEGHTEIARLLIDAGAAVNEVSEFGHTPLVVAASRGHNDAVRLLLEAGASVNIDYTVPYSGARKYGVMEGAIRENHLSTVRLLLEAGADPNWGGPDGSRPVALAAGFGTVEMLDLIVEHGADIDAGLHERNWRFGSMTPLMVAAAMGNPETVTRLLELGANPYEVSGHGKTAADLVGTGIATVSRTRQNEEDFMRVSEILSEAE